MSSPRWPDVYAGILVLLPTLPGASDVAIYDGVEIGDANAMRWVTVGYVTDEGAGTFAQERDASDWATREVGEIRCHVSFNDGGTDLLVTRSAAFSFVGAWQSALEADPTLGGRLPIDTVLALSSQVLAIQNERGSATDLLVTVSYVTTTELTH